MADINITNETTPATPAAGTTTIFIDSADNILKTKDFLGVIRSAVGDVNGPASSVSGNVAIFDGTTGKLLKDTGAVVSGTNTGDQTITLTSDVTGTGTGSFPTTIANNAVTNAKASDMVTQTIKGRTTAGTGDPEDLTVAQVKTLLNLAGTNTGDQTSIVGISGTKAQFDTAVTDGNFLYVGDVTQYTDEQAQDAVGAMVDTSLVYVDATPLLSRAALTGDVTASTGSNTTTITAAVVTNTKLAPVPTASFKGRTTAGTGDPEDLTATQVKTLLAQEVRVLVLTYPSAGSSHNHQTFLTFTEASQLVDGTVASVVKTSSTTAGHTHSATITWDNTNFIFVAVIGSGGGTPHTHLSRPAELPPTTFTSADQTITSAGALTLAHGLGATPDFIQVFLVCQTAQLNYAAGDIVLVNSSMDAGNNNGITIVPDATNLNCRFGSAAAAFEALNKTTGAGGALTNANWKVRLIARKLK
jgi:hypothetical protein